MSVESQTAWEQSLDECFGKSTAPPEQQQEEKEEGAITEDEVVTTQKAPSGRKFIIFNRKPENVNSRSLDKIIEENKGGSARILKRAKRQIEAQEKRAQNSTPSKSANRN